MKKFTKKILMGVLTTSLLLTGCGKGGKKPSNAIAKVDGEYISAEQVQEYFSYYKQQMAMYGQNNNFDEETEEGKKAAQGIREEILKSLVMQEKTVKLAKNEGVKVTDDEVNTSIDNLIEQAGGEDSLKKYLKETGQTEEEFRKEQFKSFEKQNYLTKLDEKLKEKFKPKDEDIKKRIEEDKDTLLPVYNANHILFSTMDENGQAITDEAKIEEIKQEAQKKLDEVKTDKAKFEAAFKDYKDKEEKTTSGTFIKAEELGNFSGGDMVPECSEAVKAMNPGEISQELVKTQFGFHIIQEISKATEFDELDKDFYENQIKAKYVDMVLEEEISKYKQEETDKIEVEYYDKDGKVVEDAGKAIASFDFSKIVDPNASKSEDATGGQEEATEGKVEQEEATE